MQQLRQLEITWDEALPQNIFTKWEKFQSQVYYINNLKLPRQAISAHHRDSIELHGFCDASQDAYGACMYITTTDNQGFRTTTLLCAKSRVAPLKAISMPRLELCGGLLLAQLCFTVQQATDMKFNKVHLWTDSSILLAWLKAPSNNFKTFVANRIAEIQNLTRHYVWHHVNTKDNPADVLSRGSMPSEIANNELWWHGPGWLKANQNDWPKESVDSTNKAENLEMLETRKLAFTIYHEVDQSLVKQFSSFSKLQRVIAYCMKFAKLARKMSTRSVLSAIDLQDATYCIVRIVQRQEFSKEITDLTDNKVVNSNSRIINLNPFLDAAGLIRVGGRLKFSHLNYQRKHPLLLPSNHHVTKLIIEYYHKRYFHAGAQGVLSYIRSQFWPLSGRTTVRNVLSKCITCFRAKPNYTNHMMGDLPKHRVQALGPFEICGIDYAGPILTKEKHRRGKISINKCYIAVFVCFTTKAVHLELISNLTTEAFIAALRRFVARRGCIRHIYCDNATNFVGAKNELDIINKIAKRKEIENELGTNQIQWHFIPPRSPHFGGLWEAAVKSVKYHIRRTISNTVLTFEEYLTLLTQIEACINSRPLTPLSSDPNDLIPLTPAHFLHNCPSETLYEPDLSQISTNRLSRWQHLQKMKRDFWVRWSKEYLTNLQQRTKVQKSSPPVKEGDMVILIDENLPPQRWSLGRIIKLYPGNDGITRVIEVRTAKGVFKRAVKKVCVLPIES